MRFSNRPRRMYSLFVKEGKNWIRLSPLSMELNSARRLFQGALLGGSLRGLHMGLRPVDGDLTDDVAREACWNNREKYFPTGQ